MCCSCVLCLGCRLGYREGELMTLPDWAKEIQVRTEAATPGPWSWSKTEHDDGCTNSMGLYSERHEILWLDDEVPSLFGHTNSMSFIAHSRTDIPKLLKALEIAMEALERIGRDAEWPNVLEEEETGSVDFYNGIERAKDAKKALSQIRASTEGEK